MVYNSVVAFEGVFKIKCWLKIAKIKLKKIRHPTGNQTSKEIGERAITVARIRSVTFVSTQLVSIAKYFICYSAQFLLAINICPEGNFRAFLYY